MPGRRTALVGLFATAFQGAARAQPGAAAAAAQPGRSGAALLVVDAQVGVLASVWEAPRVVANIQALVAKARAAGAPIVWVQHAGDDLPWGSDAWKLMPGFVPAAGETVVHKKYNSAFAGTALDARLKSLGVSRVVLAGAATNWCIRATAYAAVDRGYNLTLVGDAHSTESLQLPGGATVPAQAIVHDLNAVFEWLSAPKVQTKVLPTSGVSF